MANQRVANFRKVIKSESEINTKTNRIILNDIKNAAQEKSKTTKKIAYNEAKTCMSSNRTAGRLKENIAPNKNVSLPSQTKSLQPGNTLAQKSKQHNIVKKLTYDNKDLNPDLSIGVNKNDCNKVIGTEKQFVNSTPARVININPDDNDLKTIIERNFSKCSPFKLVNPTINEKKKINKKVPTVEESEVFENTMEEVLFEEYILDITKHLLSYDKVYKLSTKHLGNFEKYYKPRLDVLMWLIQNKKHLYLNSSSYLIVVRLFDNILGRVPIPEKMYKLIAATLVWIVSKSESPEYLTLKSLVYLLNHNYEKCDVLKMEQKLLSLFNFFVHIPNELNYAFYYLHELDNYKKCEILQSAVIILLEIFSLSDMFSFLTSSKLGGAVVHLALRLLYPKDVAIHLRLQQLEGFPIESTLLHIEVLMVETLKKFYTHNEIQKVYLIGMLEVFQSTYHKLEFALRANEFSLISTLSS